MILPKTINERFYKALLEKKNEYGRGFNKFLCGETGYSSGYISQVVNGNQDASQEAQIKISGTCGLDYKSFLKDDQIKRENIETEQPPTNSKEVEQLSREIKLFEEIVKMKDDKIASLEKIVAELKNKRSDGTSLGGALTSKTRAG